MCLSLFTTLEHLCHQLSKVDAPEHAKALASTCCAKKQRRLTEGFVPKKERLTDGQRFRMKRRHNVQTSTLRAFCPCLCVGRPKLYLLGTIGGPRASHPLAPFKSPFVKSVSIVHGNFRELLLSQREEKIALLFHNTSRQQPYTASHHTRRACLFAPTSHMSRERVNPPQL